MSININKLKSLFTELEVLQKAVEMAGTEPGLGLDAPALNECRNATWHLLNALDKPEASSQEAEEEIRKAERHAQRGIYDCREALLLIALDEFRVFERDFGNVVITNAIPDYVERRSKVIEIIESIDKVRARFFLERERFYDELEPYMEEIKCFNRVCAAARSELVKRLEQENASRKNERKSRVIAFFSVVIAFFSMLIAILSLMH